MFHRCVVLGLAVAAARASAPTDSVDIASARVAEALANRHGAHCSLLLRPRNTSWVGHRRLYRLARSLSSKLQVLVMSLPHYEQRTRYRYNPHRCTKAIHVVYGFDDDVRPELEKLSQAIPFGGPVWLLFLSPKNSIHDFGQFVNIPFDAVLIVANMSSPDEAILQEAYRVTPQNPLRVADYGTWSSKSGLKSPPQLSPYLRRFDLEGVLFRVASLENPPMTMFKEKPDGGYCLDGYFGHIWSELEQRLNFSSVYNTPPDNLTGAWNNSSQSWNGLVGMVMRNEADAAVSEVTILPERIRAVDYLRPLFTSRYQIFFKQSGLLIQTDSILRPFRIEVWLTFLGWLVGAAVALKVFFAVGMRYGLECKNAGLEFGGPQCLFILLAAFAQQGTSQLPRSSTCRLLVFTAYLLSLLSLITYSGTLTSYIAVDKPWRPFNSLETLLQRGSHELHQIPSTSGYTYFSNSTEPILSEIYEKLFPKVTAEELPQSHKEALERVCTDPRVAHFGEYDVTVLYSNTLNQEQGCNILVMENPLGIVQISFILPKDSPYRDAFNYHLSQMLHQGILHRFRRQAYPLSQPSVQTAFQPVHVGQVVAIHLLLGAGLFLSFCVLLLEKLVRCLTPEISTYEYKTAPKPNSMLYPWYTLLAPILFVRGWSDEELVAGLVQAIGSRYTTTCTVIVHPGLRGTDPSLYRLIKLLQQVSGHQGCILVQTFTQYTVLLQNPRQDRCSRVLNVLYGKDADIRQHFVQMSLSVKMAGAAWILLIDNSTSVHDFLHDADISFDLDLIIAKLPGNNSVLLSEAYRVSMEHPVRVTYYGLWSPNNGLQSPPHVCLYYRRTDFEGIVFRVGAQDSPPVAGVVRDGEKIINIDGYFAEVWKDLELRLNFSSTYEDSVDHTIGVLDENEEWTGLVGMLLRREIDIGLAEFTILPERHLVVDFLRPLLVTRNQLYFQKPGLVLNWTSVLRPFHKNIWIAILVWLVGTSLLLFTFHILSTRHQAPFPPSPQSTLLDFLFAAIRAFCQQGNNIIPTSTSCRLLFVSSYLVSLIVLAAYSAQLVSFITVAIPKRPFNSLQGLLDDGTYRVVVVARSAQYMYFSKAHEPVLKEVYRRLIQPTPKEQLPRSQWEALRQVCEDKHVVHFGPMAVTSRLADKMNEELRCNIISMESPLDSTFLSIALSKSSPYKDALNLHLDLMSYQGLLLRLQRKIWMYMDNRYPAFHEVQAEQVLPVHTVLLGGIFLSLLALLMERLFPRSAPTLRVYKVCELCGGPLPQNQTRLNILSSV